MIQTLSLINSFLMLMAFYIFFIRPHLLMKKEFKCKRCGYCCSLNVKINQDEIKRLNDLGYNNFLDKKGKHLKKINGRCIFLKLDNGITSCKVNNFKPSICKTFPIQKGMIWFYKDIRCRACRI